eukprot:COSAG02_NODE_100_length_36897_cov_9.681749_41_plen_76_part_00
MKSFGKCETQDDFMYVYVYCVMIYRNEIDSSQVQKSLSSESSSEKPQASPSWVTIALKHLDAWELAPAPISGTPY